MASSQTNDETISATATASADAIVGREKDVGLMETAGAPKELPTVVEITQTTLKTTLVDDGGADAAAAANKKAEDDGEEDIGENDSTDDEDDDDEEESDDDEDDDDDDEEMSGGGKNVGREHLSRLVGDADVSDDEDEFEPDEDEDEEDEEDDLGDDDADDSFAVTKGSGEKLREKLRGKLSTTTLSKRGVAATEEGDSNEVNDNGSQNGSSSKKSRAEAVNGGTTAEQKAQPSKVQSLLSSLTKKPQQAPSVLDASRQNWDAAKEQDPALKDELQAHLKSKDSFLGQQEFLDKANAAAVGGDATAQQNGSPGRRQK